MLPPQPQPFKPTKADLLAANNKTIPHLIAPGLKLLLVGINPGLYSGATGHHFARPGNRFWPALHRSGWTDRQLTAFEERELLGWGVGITNIVSRATAAADALAPEELVRGARSLRARIRRYRPRAVAFLGVGAYTTAFGHKSAKIGPQPEPLEGAALWVLPNPSGLNANYQLPDFVRLFRQLRAAVTSHAPAP
jgi:TDG/mug DNA glycosylase family protein